MRTIVKKTRKFATGLKEGSIYYTIFKGQLRQVRINKMVKSGYSGAVYASDCDYDYDIAGVGHFDGWYDFPKLYKTMEDAINGKNAIKFRNDLTQELSYCRDKKLIECDETFGVLQHSIYANNYSWNGYKAEKNSGDGGVKISVNMLNGEITIIVQDGCYLTEKECIENNKITCVTF